MSLTLAVHAQPAEYGSIAGKVVDRDNGRPLDFANVVVVGTMLGAGARDGGRFAIASVAPGTYTVKASFVGYDDLTLTGVRVDAKQATRLEFRLVRSLGRTIAPITVRRQPKKIEVTSSSVSHIGTADELKSLPFEEIADAVAMNPGITVQNGEFHVRGGRGGEVSIRIEGIEVNDPLSGGAIELGMLSLADYEVITGGMDAEYGNASSAIINYTTRSGGRNFEGDFRYTTDDYGRADKTFTNYDRFSLGVGGPTPFKGLAYYVTGEATFMDGELPTVKRYPEHKYLGGLVKMKERASSGFRSQARLDWRVNKGIRMSGEMTLDRGSSDPYVHNWNTDGYVTRMLVFPQLGVNRFSPRFYTVTGNVVMLDGPWYERALQATYLDIRSDASCQYCLLPVTDDQTLRGVRVIDFQGRGADPDQPLYVLVDYLAFAGYQNPTSTWVPDLNAAPGDSNKTRYNSAERMWTNKSLSHQFKWSMTHTLSPKTFYEIKLSRLSFDVLSAVAGKTPGEYDTAGKFTWVPGRGPTTVGAVDYYTDTAVPFFATAYDYPVYSRRNTRTYLVRSDITTQRWANHKIKGGVILQYNDLDNATLIAPGRQRQFRDPYGFSRNVFHNFNPEGSFYLQDRWEYEGMAVNGGVRYDFFSPGSGIGIEVQSSEIQRDIDRWKTQWSPRLGLAFPITDRDVFHFHYGRFIQFPEKNYIFASQDVNAGFGALGNPNLDPETSISYQAGIKHQFTNDVSGQFALFNKDYYGLIASFPITDDSTGTQRDRYVNQTYASSRGIELLLDKAFSRHFALKLAYTYSFADGVASEADFGARASGLTHLPTGERPLDWDQRHMLNCTLTVARAADWSATTTYQFESGHPWTPRFRSERREDPLHENSRRLPSQHLVSVRGEKFFDVGGLDLRFFVDGVNLLDDRGIALLEPTVFPALENATEAYRAYATESGRFGGAYLRDSDGDGQDEFFPVNDPRVFGPRRSFRVGLGVEF
jgi:outer membrane receptor protein involved in Fe transport